MIQLKVLSTNDVLFHLVSSDTFQWGSVNMPGSVADVDLIYDRSKEGR
jgi:hypothetical protein